MASEFKVGDEVTFWMDDFEPWQGGKGTVRELPIRGWGYEVEVTEVPPKNAAIRVGHLTTFQSEWLRPLPGTQTEMVEHPPHYGGEDDPYEVIKVAEAWGLDKDAYLFNVLKYIARAGKKQDTPTLQDLRKALFYLGRKITNLVKEKETK